MRNDIVQAKEKPVTYDWVDDRLPTEDEYLSESKTRYRRFEIVTESQNERYYCFAYFVDNTWIDVRNAKILSTVIAWKIHQPYV